VDDTLYDVGTGFTAHRNGEGAQRFMVEELNFPSLEAAKLVRDEYFERYHSTSKALAVAEDEGRFPEPKTPLLPEQGRERRFYASDLSNYWAAHLDFTILGKPDPDLIQMFESLQNDCGLQLVAFSNGPRTYVKRALKEMALDNFFAEDRLFAVDDVLPHCKPEPEAFELILKSLNGVKPEECIMVEDSMKNTRAAKALGLKTVLIAGRGRLRPTSGGGGDGGGGGGGGDGDGGGGGGGDGAENTKALEAEATKPGDAPMKDDPAVDVCVEVCSEMRQALPGLWHDPPVFKTAPIN
jgi:putative hydrolase of the HAD superfamily